MHTADSEAVMPRDSTRRYWDEAVGCLGLALNRNHQLGRADPPFGRRFRNHHELEVLENLKLTNVSGSQRSRPARKTPVLRRSGLLIELRARRTGRGDSYFLLRLDVSAASFSSRLTSSRRFLAFCA